MNSVILIISGPPGAGKTTVARRLAETWEGLAVHIPTDAFYSAILSGYIAPWLPESHAQNATVTEAIAAAAAVYAAGWATPCCWMASSGPGSSNTIETRPRALTQI
jgi:predicted ATPase